MFILKLAIVSAALLKLKPVAVKRCAEWISGAKHFLWLRELGLWLVGRVSQLCGRRHRRYSGQEHTFSMDTHSKPSPSCPLQTGSDSPSPVQPHPPLWNDSPSSLGLFCFCACCCQCRRHESLLDFQPAGLVEEDSLFGPLVPTLLKRALARGKLLWEDDEKGGEVGGCQILH